MVGCCYFAPVASRVSPRRASYFFSAKPKKSNQKKGEPRPCRFAVPCATRKMEHPRSGFAASPSRGRHQRPGKAGLRGAPGRGCASRTSPRLLVRCAHLAGVGFASFLTPHCSQGHGTPCPYTKPLTPHSSSWATTRVAPTPSLLRPHSYALTPHPSLLTPHSYALTPHPSPLTRGPSRK